MKTINNILSITTILYIMIEVVLTVIEVYEPSSKDLLLFIAAIYLNLYIKMRELENNQYK